MEELLKDILVELRKINEFVDYKKKEELRKIDIIRNFPSPQEGFSVIAEHTESKRKGY